MSEQPIPPAGRSSLFNLPLVSRVKVVKDLLLTKLDGLHEQLQTIDSTVQTLDSNFKALGTTTNDLAKNDIALLEATIGLIETLQENQQSIEQQNRMILALLRQTIASIQHQEHVSSQVLPEVKTILQEIRQQEQTNHQALERSLHQNVAQITQQIQLTEQKIDQSSNQITQQLELTERKIDQSTEHIAQQLEQTEQTVKHVSEHQSASLKTTLHSIQRQNSSILYYTSKASSNGNSNRANGADPVMQTPSIGVATTKPFYFFHIPKTAGTSLRFWLLELFAQEEYLECFFLEDLEKISSEKIAQHRFFSGHLGFSLCQALPQQPNIVTWLREPIEREISQYNYLRQKRSMLLDQVTQSRSVEYIDAASHLGIADLLQSDLHLGYYDNLQVRYLSGIAPGQYGQTANTEDADRLSLWTRAAKQNCDDEMLAAAKRNLLDLLHFGLCESMQASIELLCYRANWAPRQFNLHLNRSQTGAKALADALSAEEIAIIRDVNQYDLALYEFAKAEFKLRYQELWEESLRAKKHHFDLCSDAEKLPTHIDPFKPEPQTSPVVSDFLEEHFQHQHSGDKRLERLNIKFSDPIFLSGWYPREYNDSLKTWLRWAGPDTTSYLYLPLKPGSSYRISFWILFCMSTDIQESISLEIERTPIPLQSLYVTDVNDNVQSLLTGVIPAELINQGFAYTKIIFKTNRVVSLEVAESDPAVRYVSFATNGLAVEPVTDPSLVEALLQTNAQLQKFQDRSHHFEAQVQQIQTALHDSQAQVQQFQAELQQLKEHAAAIQIKQSLVEEQPQPHVVEEQMQLHVQGILQESQVQTQQLQSELHQSCQELEQTKKNSEKDAKQTGASR
nr:MAG: hypothetical protein EDM05_03875 [Leptolyngbya sp. IPPAS B-1204]